MPYRMSTTKFTKVREPLLWRIARTVGGGVRIAFYMLCHFYFPFHCTVIPEFKEFYWSPDPKSPQGELLRECYMEGARGLDSLYPTGSMYYIFTPLD